MFLNLSVILLTVRVSVQGGLCPGEGFSVQRKGVSVQRRGSLSSALCPGGSLSRGGGPCPEEGVSAQGSLPRGGSLSRGGGSCPQGGL